MLILYERELGTENCFTCSQRGSFNRDGNFGKIGIGENIHQCRDLYQNRQVFLVLRIELTRQELARQHPCVARRKKWRPARVPVHCSWLKPVLACEETIAGLSERVLDTIGPAPKPHPGFTTREAFRSFS